MFSCLFDSELNAISISGGQYSFIFLLPLFQVLPSFVSGQTMTYVNVSSQIRPVFVVNFDIASVICQHSADPSDLHVHPISILCDKKVDCYNNPSMNDESFPYCSKAFLQEQRHCLWFLIYF